MLPLLSFWSHLYELYFCIPRKKGEGKLWSEADAGYLPSGNNMVKKLDSEAGSCWWTVVAAW